MNMKTRMLPALLLLLAMAMPCVAEGFPPYETEHLLTLVNREHRIAYDYVPGELVLPDVQAARGKENNIYLRPEASRALEQLFSAAEKAGHTLYAVSGYRSYPTQKAIFQRKVEEVGEKQAMRTVAPPGASEHQLGLAMDINGETTVKKGLVREFGETPEGIWVAENAHRFGFIIRYQQGRTDITGYAYEPWHLRYLGVKVASAIYVLDITLEEYHALLQVK